MALSFLIHPVSNGCVNFSLLLNTNHVHTLPHVLFFTLAAAFFYISFSFIRLDSINSISSKIRLYGRINSWVEGVKEKRGCHGFGMGGSAGGAVGVGKSDDINFNTKVTCCAPFPHSQHHSNEQ